jgi:hypothetical protein
MKLTISIMELPGCLNLNNSFINAKQSYLTLVRGFKFLLK